MCCGIPLRTADLSISVDKGEFELCSAKLFDKGLKKGQYRFSGVLNHIKNTKKGVCTAECNFVHRAAHGSSAQGGDGEDLGDKAVDPKLASQLLQEL